MDNGIVVRRVYRGEQGDQPCSEGGVQRGPYPEHGYVVTVTHRRVEQRWFVGDGQLAVALEQRARGPAESGMAVYGLQPPLEICDQMALLEERYGKTAAWEAWIAHQIFVREGRICDGQIEGIHLVEFSAGGALL